MASSFIHLHLYLYLLLRVISFNYDKMTGDSVLVSRHSALTGAMQGHADKHPSVTGSCCLVVILFSSCNFF